MKGYITASGECYIFPQTAAEIPEVEADAFYVQEENFTEWVAENESIADKLVKYNYNLMSVQPKVWAGHTNDDLAITYDITLSGAQDLIQNLSLNKSKAAEDESITITPGGSSYTAQWVDVTSTDAQIAWDNSNTLWSFTMPATDVTATATARTLYHVSKAGDYQSDFSIQPNSYMPQHQYQYDSYVNLVPAANINPTDGYTMTVQTDEATPSPVSASWDSANSYWYFAMPASDVVATMTKEEPQPTTHAITINSAVELPEGALKIYGGGEQPDPTAIEANTHLSIDSPTGYTFDPESVSGDTLLDVAFSDSQTPELADGWVGFYMPNANLTVTIIVHQQQQPTTYSFNIDEEGNLSNIGSYEEGDSVQYTFDHALQQDEPGMWHWEYTMSPASLDNYNFSTGTPAYLDETDPENPVQVPEVPAEISFTMPASDVLFTITRVEDVQP